MQRSLQKKLAKMDEDDVIAEGCGIIAVEDDDSDDDGDEDSGLMMLRQPSSGREKLREQVAAMQPTVPKVGKSKICF